MTSENAFQNVGILKDEDMENIELHRSISMSSGHVEILEQSKNEKSDEEKQSVHTYVGNKTRLVLSELKNMKVEVVMFLYMFSYIMRSVTTTTMVMEKVCLVHLGHSLEVCDNLSEYPGIKTTVEKMANNYHLGHSLIQLVPSAVLSLFIGSWSDKYSRKIPLIAALVGIALDGLGTLMCAHFMHSRAEFLFFPAIFTGLSGGFISTLLILYSYASDISTPENRTMKFALVEITFSMSMPLGNLAGGWIFKYYRYIPVFLTSTCGHIVGLFWVIFILEETRGLDVKDSWMVKFRAFWSLDSVTSSYKATIKKRPNKGREQIWLLLIAMSIAIFTFASSAGVLFLYVHHLYDWDNTTYSTVSAIFSVFSMLLMFIIVPLSKKYHIGDPYLGLAGSVSIVLKNICLGLAKTKGLFFLANLLGLLSGLSSLAGRSRISKVASQEDLGKVFAFVTVAESLMPIISVAAVSQVFNASLDVFPGLVFIVMGVLMFCPIGVFIWLSRLPKVDYDSMNNSPQNISGHMEGQMATQNLEEKPHEKY